MFLQFIEVFPVNLLQIAFLTLTSVGALLIWKSRIYRNLALFFLYQSTLMVLNFVEETRGLSFSYLITPALTLLVGPLLYFFVRSLVHEQDIAAGKRILHTFPALLALPFTEFTQSVIAVGTASQFLYMAFSFRLLQRYHLTAMAVRSDADSMKLTWIARALATFACVLVIDLIRLNMQPQTPIDIKMAWYFLDTLVFFCISLFLLFKAVSKPQLFDAMLPYEKLVKGKPKSGEADDQQTATSLCQNIEDVVVTKELFKQQRLSIGDIANETGINVKDISWAINCGANKNFCEFINSLRIQFLKAKIEAGLPKDCKLLDLAFESGFNSKSTFNTVFKREVGMTPSQFLQQRSS